MIKRHLPRIILYATIAAMLTAPLVFFLLTALGVEHTLRTAIVAAITGSISTAAALQGMPPRRVPVKP